jgi:hypothetical protein
VYLGKAEKVKAETVKCVKEATGAAVLHVFDDLRLRMQPGVAAIGRYADWTLFCHDDPNLTRAYLDAGCQRVGYATWGFDPEVYYPRGGERTLDAVFAGHLYGREKEARLEMVKAFVDAGLGVHTYGPLQYAGNFGDGWQSYADEWGFIAHPFADMDEIAQAYSCAKIALGLSNDQVRLYFAPRRTYESMACGCLHLVRYAPGMEEMFDCCHHLVWWKTLDELAELARYYLAHDGEREAIAQAGRRYVLANYTWDHAIQRYLVYVGEARR